MLPSVSELPLEASERDDDDLHFIDPHPIPEPYNHFVDLQENLPVGTVTTTGNPYVRLVGNGTASVQLVGGGGAGGSGVSIPWSNTTTTNATTGWVDWGNPAGSYSSAMEVRYNALPVITDPNSFITVTTTA